MNVKDLCEKMDMQIKGGEKGLNKEVKGVYSCDLLSWVMAHGKNKDAWVTIQTHSNTIAVASLLEMSCIIIPENAEIEEETIKRADDEEIPILSSSLSSYEICYRIHDIIKD
jgi:serine kinase of HPr protein (carbohydrate metabolism regulator)